MKKANTQTQKAVIYARFSSDMQREESIEAQVRACREYALRNNIEVVGEYVDRAKSATTDQRPEFLQMVKDSKNSCFDLVLVHKLDRFSRNRFDSAGYRKKLKRNNVQLISVLENYDPDSPEGGLLESVLEGMNEFYSRNLAREVEKGKHENALKCLHVGGIPPLGYDVDRNTMKLVVNEFEAKAVQMIFTMYLEGESYSSIIRALNQGGYKTKFGKTFGNNSLYSILHNEKYTGVYIYSKSAPKDVDGKRNGHKYKSDDEIIRIEGGIPALISKDDFERVQEKLSKRRRCGSAPRAKQTYLLSGKVICGQCNHVYVGNCRPERPDHPEYITYRCNNRNKRPRCDGWEIKREILESMVLGELARLVFNDFMIPKLVSAYEQYQNSFSSEELRDQKRIKKHIAETQGNIDNLVAVVMKTASDTLVAKINELEEEKRGYERQLHELGRKNERRSMTEEGLQHSFHQAREMLKEGKLSTVKKLIERYIQKVIVNGRKIEIQFDLNVGGDSPRQRQGVKKETLPSPVEDESMFPLISQPMLVRFGGEGGI